MLGASKAKKNELSHFLKATKDSCRENQASEGNGLSRNDPGNLVVVHVGSIDGARDDIRRKIRRTLKSLKIDELDYDIVMPED